MIELCLLGATGSIGSQVLDLIREKRDVYRLAAFSFGHNINKALDIIDKKTNDHITVNDISVRNTVDELLSNYGLEIKDLLD